MKWPRHLNALNSRNYRLYFFGQLVSLVGTWMTSTATLWLVYHLSSSPFALGLVAFANQAPMFFLAPFAGVWIDRVNRHRLLLVTQILSMLQSLALALLTFAHLITVEWLIALAFVQGAINGADLPTRQALVIAFVEQKDQLSNAIALNSSIFNLARLVGPALAGFTIVAVGPAGCFLIDSISYLAVIGSLLAMHSRFEPHTAPRQHPFIELRDGFRYAFGAPAIRGILLTIAMISLVGFSYSVLTPMYARDIFHGTPKTFGYLMAASGIGALVGAAYLGSRTTLRGLGKVIALGVLSLGTGLIGFALSRIFPLSLGCLFLIGLGGVLVMASSNTLLQALIEEEKRGRVMSIYTMAFTGTVPLGNLAVGAIAGAIGPSLALTISGVICLVVGLNFIRQLPILRASGRALLAKLQQ